MTRTVRALLVLTALASAAATAACQKPTDASDTIDPDDIVTAVTSPETALAEASTDGRTYRVVRGNNQPDDILAFDWKTSFTLNITLNDQADDDDLLTFPVDITSATLKVQQASGGIVTTPTGGDTEHYDYVTESSGNRFGAVNTTATIKFDVWYDLPSLRREALITVTLGFKDDDGNAFTKNVEVKVAP